MTGFINLRNFGTKWKFFKALFLDKAKWLCAGKFSFRFHKFLFTFSMTRRVFSSQRILCTNFLNFRFSIFIFALFLCYGTQMTFLLLLKTFCSKIHGPNYASTCNKGPFLSIILLLCSYPMFQFPANFAYHFWAYGQLGCASLSMRQY